MIKLFSLLIFIISYITLAEEVIDEGSLIDKIPVNILLWVGAVSVLLLALAKFFTFIAEQTENETDNKIAYYFGKIASFIAKLLDTINGNTRDKK